ncbi:mannose-specific lectin-like [Macadamia integrifolia]|uniref:mannose-specific lectin-like n=1 Tax=Macadamia integrifolia TaxID=60698 RepID=UPI001C4E496E|nr:mannose-specific lectin-like [Macadamia integrifolia]
MAAIVIQSIIISTLLYFFLSLLIKSPIGCEAENILYTNEALNNGDSLQYDSYKFKMQKDCNLVLSDAAIWASNTDEKGENCYCRMQSDGNLVIYEPGEPDRAIWATNTCRDSGNYALILQDGNLVIYGSSIWATGTTAQNGAITWLGVIGSDGPKGSICTR